jgi:plasmid replication initiation protein
MAKKSKNDNDDLDTGFNPKYAKLIQHLTESLDSMSTDDLKEAIVKSQKSISDVEKDMEADEHLAALKEEIKQISGAFSDVKKIENAKSMYCVFLLRSRGES